MSIYDDFIKQIADFREQRQVKEFNGVVSIEKLRESMPVQVGPGANPGIILRSDTYAELGNPTKGSMACILWTENPSLIRDGKITLIGPDVSEEEGASRPFGQVLIVGGKRLNNESQEKIEEYQHISDHLEGYMVRSSAQNIWGRVSKDAIAKGFTLETLGKALMITIKANVEDVEAMEVLFVTSSKEDVKVLGEMAEQVNTIRKDIIKEVWKERGYDLDCDLDCNSCANKVTCDDIREMILTRKKREREEASESEG